MKKYIALITLLQLGLIVGAKENSTKGGTYTLYHRFAKANRRTKKIERSKL